MRILSEIYITLRMVGGASYRSPTVVLKSLIPPVVLVIRVLIKMYVDCGLPLLLLDLDVVSRCKGVDVDNTTMRENLVVDQRGEFLND